MSCWDCGILQQEDNRSTQHNGQQKEWPIRSLRYEWYRHFYEIIEKEKFSSKDTHTNKLYTSNPEVVKVPIFFQPGKLILKKKFKNLYKNDKSATRVETVSFGCFQQRYEREIEFNYSDMKD